MNRRAFLTVSGTTLSISMLGCLGNEEDLERSEIRSNEYELKQFAAFSYPDWYSEDSHGEVKLYTTEKAAFDSLAFDEVSSDRRPDVEAFVENTNFNENRLLFVASVGPYQYYTKIELQELARENGRLVGTAKAKRDDEGYDAAEYNFPSALVRVTFEEDPVDKARITLIDGWGDEANYDSEVS